MGINSTKSSLTNTEYSLTFSSINNFYRSLSIIQGEFNLNTRTKLFIEKKLRIDLIGELIENKKISLSSSSRSLRNSSQINKNNIKQIFFTYSYPLVTSHQNGIARTIKQQHNTFPFRIPLGINLPPSCEFKEFSIIYYLDIYHDGRLLPNIRKKIILAPPIHPITIPLSYQVTGYHNITMKCSLQKLFYSGRDGSIVLLYISIINPKEKQIEFVTVQLIQIVSLNGIKYENEIFTTIFNEINITKEENQIKTTYELHLPKNLPPTYIPNENNQPDNVPFISISYELCITTQIIGVVNPNLRLSVPIGIE